MGTTSIDRGPSRCYHLGVQRKEGSIGWSTLEETLQMAPRHHRDGMGKH
jgi:hypothetical protein